MSGFRKGMVQQPPQAPQQQVGKTATVIGRQLPKRENSQGNTQERSRIITNDRINARPGGSGITARFETQHVRGLIVDGTGRPLRGLSQATIEAHKAHTEDATEQCTRCGKMRPPAQMKNVIPNAENPNNPLRVCITECVPLTYKNPYDDREKWQPQVPAVRFDRERGTPYDAVQAGVTIKDLVTKDAYHNEKEVDPEFRQDHLYGEGNWSGGGRAGRTLEAAKQRPGRRR